MKTIKITDKEYGFLKNLVKEYNKIYGDVRKTVWNIDDLERLRKIGEEFMDILRKYL